MLVYPFSSSSPSLILSRIEVQHLHVVQGHIAEAFPELPGVEDIGISVLLVSVYNIYIGVPEDEHGNDACNISQGLPVDVGVLEFGIYNRALADSLIEGRTCLVRLWLPD